MLCRTCLSAVGHINSITAPTPRHPSPIRPSHRDDDAARKVRFTANMTQARILALLIAALGIAFPLTAWKNPTPHDPQTLPTCPYPGHDRLVERRGRDVCEPARNQNDQPVASGLMPTLCPSKDMRLIPDFIATTDICFGPRRETASKTEPKKAQP